MPLGRGGEAGSRGDAGEPGRVAHRDRAQVHAAAHQVLAQAVHGFLRLLERAARGGGLTAKPPGAVREAGDRVVRLDLDDRYPKPWGDDDEVGLAFNLPDVVGDREGVKDGPVVGPGALCQRRKQLLLPGRGGLGAVPGHHSSHRALLSLNSTRAW